MDGLSSDSTRPPAGSQGEFGAFPDTEHDRAVLSLCRDTLRYSREREYTGWDYVDGLSSRLLRSLPFESKWLNLAVQETVKRAPVNVRPLLLVEQRRSYLGAALFTMANLDAYDLTGESLYIDEAGALADWLLAQDIDGYSGFCGTGHRHRIQRLDRDRAPPPDEGSGVVSLSYVVQSVLRYADTCDDPGYAERVRSASEFVLTDLEYTETEDGAHINYTVRGGEAVTLNANAVGARLLVDLSDRFGEPRLLAAGRAILDYVAAKQTAVGGWMYRDPPTASHLSMDSFHNGFIIEALLHYQAVTGTDRYSGTLERALSFYRGLFGDDGTPYWDESSQYPHDIHSAAQGIIVFAKTGDLATARRIIAWTVENLYAGDGQFYYQQRRFYTKRITLMRWCQAWMAYALSTYLRARRRALQ